jgi:carbon-monoxide dehydrogenase large subunit
MQAPNRLADALTEILDCEPDAIRVLAPDIGGSFGQKGDVVPEDVVVARLAMDLRRPVKWIEDRTENMLAASQARDQRVHVRVAARRDGTLLAIDADVLSDIGAYGSRAHGPLVEAGGTPSMIPGPYRLDAYRYRTAAVSTNKCPFGAYRGVGTVMAAFVHERVMDTLAQRCGLDRVEVRARNLVSKAAMPYTSVSGRTYDTGDYLRALRSAERRIAPLAEHRRQQFRGDPAVRIGVGFANFVEYSAVTPEEYRNRGLVGTRGDDTARAELDDGGLVHLWTSLPAVGQGSATAFSQIAADALDVACERVVVHRTDTGLVGMVGTGTGSSRSMVSGGGAVWNAATGLLDRIRAAVAEITGIPGPQIALGHDGVQVSGDDVSELVRYVDVVKSAAAGPFGFTATFGPDRLVYPSATHACVVSVDSRTGAVRVLDYVVAQDCGLVINPAIVQGQIRGGVAQGIGAALLEGHVYDDQGQLQTSSLMDYLLPTPVDVPDIDVELYGDPTPASLLGVKGMGESGAVPSPAAVASAVSDAVGVEVLSLPIDPGWLAEHCADDRPAGAAALADVDRPAWQARIRRAVPAATVVALVGGAVGALLRKRLRRRHEEAATR